MSAHTPGPWTFRRADYPDEGEVAPGYSSGAYVENAAIFGADGERVVGNDEYNVFYSPAKESNVSLLLAAPDLLAALERAINEAVADDMDDWYANARAVVAKAKGETP